MQYASNELQNDKEVVLAAVSNDGFAWQYASDALQHDTNIVIVAIQNAPYIQKYLPDNIKEDPKIAAWIVSSSALNTNKSVVFSLNDDGTITSKKF